MWGFTGLAPIGGSPRISWDISKPCLLDPIGWIFYLIATTKPFVRFHAGAWGDLVPVGNSFILSRDASFQKATKHKPKRKGAKLLELYSFWAGLVSF